MKFITISVIYKALISCLGCLVILGYTSSSQHSNHKLVTMSPSHTGINFVNKIPLPSFFHNQDFMFVITGGGLAAGDVNNDGLIDLVFTGAYTKNKLFINRGDFRFEEIKDVLYDTDTIGMSFGVCIVDINGDKWNDIYICKYGYAPNKLYINNQDGSFTEQAKDYGLDWSGNSIQSTFFDYDNDGDLDMYLILNGKLKEGYRHGGDHDRFFRNNGNGTFTEIAEQIGIRDKGYGLSATAADINNDGWVDLFVAQDFEQRDLLYINQKDGTFKDMASYSFPHCSYFSMGNDIADFNNDGLLDIFSVDMLPRASERRNTQFGIIPIFSPTFDSSQTVKNVLHLNRGDGTFSDIAYLSGVADTEWSWTTWFADLDNDGYKDIYVTNGLAREIMDRDVNRFGDNHNIDFTTKKGMDELVKKYPQVKISNFLFKNKGDLRFEDVTEQWGMTEFVNTNSAVYADLDNDGDLDIVQNNLDTIPSVFKNTTAEQKQSNFLRCVLEGKDKNTNGLNAKVVIRTGNQIQMQEMTAVRGFTSGITVPLHFGVGQSRTIDELTVTWLDGTQQILYSIPVNRTITLSQRNAVSPSHSYSTANSIYSKQKNNKSIDPKREKKQIKFHERILSDNFMRTERVHDDFFHCRLQPNKLSMNGPAVAVADVNNDGRDDVFLGGGEGTSPIIALQGQNGELTMSIQRSLTADSMYEDQGALFFDIDMDGDEDLYVASGGNESVIDELQFREDRIYLNDGKGNLTRSTQSLVMDINGKGSSSCVVGADFDGDGDIDIFVGGRNQPGEYPKIPRSYFLYNDNGILRDVTDMAAPELRFVGMVTSALWTDFDNDGDRDLIVVGEWMAPTIFVNNGVSLDKTIVLDSLYGWWNSINGGDFDNDGDTDYVLGNLGWNSRYKPTKESPVRMYVRDFDHNGSNDHIMTLMNKDKEVVARLRDIIVQQIPTIQKKFPNYAAFAKASIRDIFQPSDIDSSLCLTATTFSSMILENKGKKEFTAHDLPALAQMSPLYGTIIEDINDDGYVDLVGTGNFYGPDLEMWRYDANNGFVLYGDGRMSFTAEPFDKPNGFTTKGDTRTAAMIRNASSHTIAILVSVNNGMPQLFDTGIHYADNDVSSSNHQSSTGKILSLTNKQSRKVERYWGNGYYSQSPFLSLKSKSINSIKPYGSSKKK